MEDKEQVKSQSEFTMKALMPLQVCCLVFDEGEEEGKEEIVAISPNGNFYVLNLDAKMIKMSDERKEKIEKVLEEAHRKQQLAQGVRGADGLPSRIIH